MMSWFLFLSRRCWGSGMNASRACAVPQDRREPTLVTPRERRDGARQPSARIFLEARWAGRVRSPVERSRGAVMRRAVVRPDFAPYRAEQVGEVACDQGNPDGPPDERH